MTLNLKAVFAAVTFAGLSMGAASAATVTVTVDGTDNMYFDSNGNGTAPSAVADAGGAINFAGLGPLTVTATGLVVDAGSTATGPDGTGGIFAGLPVYSLIGQWSSTSGSITSLGAAFFVGSSNVLSVPGVSPAYLFLAENDGIFSDNSGAYTVTINYGDPVPLPAALPLFATALGAFGVSRRMKKKTA